MKVVASYYSCLVAVLVTAIAAKSSGHGKVLCADNQWGAFVALAIDEDSYDSIPGAKTAGYDQQQSWRLVHEGSGSASPPGEDDKKESGPINSMSGQFLQVLPDVGRVYPPRGEHLKSVSQLQAEAPYLTFRIRVTDPGWHTLFLRWTGGDNVGGGDSLYVSLVEEKKDNVVIGQRTLKPAVVPIDAGAFTFAGCCYDMNTHACPCFKTVPDNATCPSFVGKHEASGFGAKCRMGPGVMEFVPKPHWYLYAGQEEGNVMDFDSEPWDATCEAEGSSTSDSGRDFASWELKAGVYRLQIFAREDGTAFDGLYLAGPNAEAPDMTQRFAAGESTICKHQRLTSPVLMTFSIVGAVAVIGLLSMMAARNGLMEPVWSRVQVYMPGYRMANARAGLSEYSQMELNPEEL